MKIKRIEVENFKTFKGKRTFDFDYNFIGITGPNGSGKSNFADAIYFIMGPKSSNRLRVHKLSELAYNGGANGRPANECKVTIVFDNSEGTFQVEGDELRITRKIKITNRAEDKYTSNYYVNGKPTKQSDVHHLLESAGIYPDGYNIIQQGDIISFISKSRFERRKIIDEISGVSQYDSYIERAQKKQKEVEENINLTLARLEEINIQLQQLKAERDIALKYREYVRGRTIASWKLLNRQKKNKLQSQIEKQERIVKLEGEIARKENLISELATKKDQVLYKIKKIEEEIRRLGGEKVQRLQDQIDALQEEIVHVKADIERDLGRIDDMKEEMAVKTEQLKKAEKEIARGEKELRPLENKLASSTARREELTARMEELRKTASEGNEKVQRLQKELAEVEESIRAIDDEVVEKRKSVEAEKAAIEGREGEKERLAISLNSYEKDITDLEWKISEAKKSSRDVEKKLKEMQEQFYNAQREENALSKELEDVTDRLRKASTEYERLRARREAMENADSQTRAVSLILEARDRGIIKGIVGKAADLLEVEEQYQTAISVAAGNRLNAIIVENEDVYDECKKLLIENRAGRATFLPLTKMIASRPRGKALLAVRSPDSLGFAIDIVSFDERYRNAFWYIFGDTVVMKTLSAAKKHMGGVRMVTLEGDLIEASGAMTGGSMSNRQANVFASASSSQLEKLSHELQSLRQRQEEISSRLSELRSRRRQLDSEMRQLREGSDMAAITTMERTLKDDKENARKIKEAIKAVEAEIATRKRSIENIQTEIASLEGRKKDLLDRRDSIIQEIRASTPENLQKELNDIGAELDTLNNNIALMSEKANSLRSSIETARNIMENLRTEVEARTAETERLNKEVTALREKEATLLSRKKELDERMGRMGEQLREMKERKDRLHLQTERIDADVEKARRDISDHKDLIITLKGEITSIEEDIGRLNNEINAMLDRVSAYLSEEEREMAVSRLEGEETLRNRIREFEKKIEELGAVNQKAVETYNDLSARKESMETELENLNSEKEKWLKVETETQRKKKELFLYVFNQINSNMQRIYPEISNGGKAFLELENPENPFEGGMEVRVKPVGKKMTRLDTLSGGEKGVVTMALMFAIQEYSPSPFYLLDEIDQNMDAINCEIIGTRIKENSATAQFIVISLHAPTIREADILYGVTMGPNATSEVYAISHTQIGEDGEIIDTENNIRGVDL